MGQSSSPGDTTAPSIRGFLAGAEWKFATGGQLVDASALTAAVALEKTNVDNGDTQWPTGAKLMVNGIGGYYEWTRGVSGAASSMSALRTWALLEGAQTFTGVKTFAAGSLKLAGSTSGSLTLAAPAVAGAGTVVFPASGTLVTATDLAAKADITYVDSIAANIGRRDTVRTATTANIVISTALNAGDVIDGITLANGEKVLVKDQTAQAENGVYVVGATPARDTQYDAWSEFPGSAIVVQAGTANSDSMWLCTSNAGGTLGTTAITFSKLNFQGGLLPSNNLSDLANAATARGNLGLGSVNNTADLDKPVSNATQNALDLKADASALTSGLATKKRQGVPTAITGATLTLTDADDGNTYTFSGACTITIANGRIGGFGVGLRTPATGTLAINFTGGATISGGATSASKVRADGDLIVIHQIARTPDIYLVI